MGANTTAYKVNIKLASGKSQKEITAAYTQFYVGVVSRVLKSSPMSIEKKNEMLDTIIKKYSETSISPLKTLDKMKGICDCIAYSPPFSGSECDNVDASYSCQESTG